MPPEQQDIQAAIAEAVGAADLAAIKAPMGSERQNGTAQAEAEAQGTIDPPAAAPGEDQSSRAETPAAEHPAEPAQAVEQSDVPTSYWGVDLSDIPVEKRGEVIAHFEQQDSTIRKLQEKLSAEPEPVTPENVEPPVEISDDDLIRALGFDPEDWQTQQMAPALLTMARSQMALEEQVEQMRTIETGRQAETAWNAELNTLEETYGALPFERADVLRHAMQESIQTPYELYFRLAAPVRKEVESAAAAARRVQDKREAAGLKPRSAQGVEPNLPKDVPLRDIVRMAAAAAEKETGVRWSAISSQE